ncbi:MAG: sterol desaturase family protein [Ideonella sp.]|nr:sterol desaturase family protein [Ideonella sp.]
MLQAHTWIGKYSAVWFVLCLVGFGLADWLEPYRFDWHPSAKTVSLDAALLLAAGLVDSLLKYGGLWLAQEVANMGHSPGWAAAWPLVVAVPAAVVLGELGPYALHRWAHSNHWGWRWHRVHHAPTQVNASNSVRVHPLNLVWNVASRGLLWWCLGFSPEALAWATMFMLLQSVAVHANVQGSIGPLARVIGSAQAHRWHHSTKSEEAVNFGTSVPLWDQLLGTWHWAEKSGPAEVGLHR